MCPAPHSTVVPTTKSTPHTTSLIVVAKKPTGVVKARRRSSAVKKARHKRALIRSLTKWLSSVRGRRKRMDINEVNEDKNMDDVPDRENSVTEGMDTRPVQSADGLELSSSASSMEMDWEVSLNELEMVDVDVRKQHVRPFAYLAVLSRMHSMR